MALNLSGGPDTIKITLQIVEGTTFFLHGSMKPEPEFFNFLRSPEIDTKQRVPPAYVAWRAGTITMILLGS
jgi:hypothetical protein